MLTVPRAENLVGTALISGAKLQSPDMSGTGMEAFGHGLREVGAAGADLVQTLREHATVQSLADAKDADTELTKSASDLLDDPDHGVLAMRGKAAADAYKPTLAALSARADELGAGIKGEAGQTAWKRAKAQRMEVWQSTLARHAIQQTDAYLDDLSETRLKVNASAAVNAYDDPGRSEQSVATVASEMAEVGRRNSWTPEQVAGHTLLQVSSVRRAVALRQAEQNPDYAEAYAKQFSGQITGTDAAAIDKGIAVERERRDAEQRRVEAQGRADEAHARSLQREQLSTVKVQLDTGAGTSADWDQLANGYTAIGDTSAAAEARARGAQMKASDAYRGASLPQIDQRIGALETKGALNPTEASELKGLRDRRSTTAARLNQPGGALAQYQFATGKPIEALSSQDPATAMSAVRPTPSRPRRCTGGRRLSH